MMNEKEIIIIEKYIEGTLDDSEKTELSQLINSNPELKSEIEEQKKVKEVLKKMSLKNPPKEVWDNYWLGIYNRLERGIAWIAILIGALIIAAFGALEFIDKFFGESDAPIIIKIAVIFLLIGFFILILSVLRERLSISSKDKYKEVQR
jgi:hypothetical protein